MQPFCHQVATMTQLESELRIKDKQIQDVLTEVKKMQAGTINCGTSGWVDEGMWKTKTVRTYFQQAYKTKPAVHLSFLLINDSHDDDDENEFGVGLVSVTNTYFTMKCKSYKEIRIESFQASWMSFPKF